MKIFSINAGYFMLDGGAMYGVVPKKLWQKANPADDNNMCSWAMRCMLIDHGNHRILIDTGMGTKQDEKFFSHYYLHGDDTLTKSLAAKGYKPEDITDVFHTHLHFDHCGGAIARAENGDLFSAFPNAVFWTNPLHWEAAIHPNAREKASFLTENLKPMEDLGLLRFVAAEDGIEWMPDIRIRIVNGHTTAMMLPQIKYNGKTILYAADLIPSASHVSLPWVMAYDMRPEETLKEKEVLLKEAVANDWILFFEHDPVIECATLVGTERGIKVGEIFKLEEITA